MERDLWIRVTPVDESDVTIGTWSEIKVSMQDKISSCKRSIDIYSTDNSTPSILVFYNQKLIKLLQQQLIEKYCS